MFLLTFKLLRDTPHHIFNIHASGINVYLLENSI